MSDIEQDDLQQWLSNPVTQWVLGALAAEAENIRDIFLARHFYGPDCDPYEMALLRGQYMAIASVSADELTFDRISNAHADTVDAFFFEGHGVAVVKGGPQ